MITDDCSSSDDGLLNNETATDDNPPGDIDYRLLSDQMNVDDCPLRRKVAADDWQLNTVMTTVNKTAGDEWLLVKMTDRRQDSRADDLQLSS